MFDFLGGDELREAHGLGLISFGGDTWSTGVSTLGGVGAKPGVGGGGECERLSSCW